MVRVCDVLGFSFPKDVAKGPKKSLFLYQWVQNFGIVGPVGHHPKASVFAVKHITKHTILSPSPVYKSSC